ncbi:MAG: hypothetical protein ACI91O_000566 [Candidatus Poriferisodalaceae bacterium]|jgi:hypothetical protein
MSLRLRFTPWLATLVVLSACGGTTDESVGANGATTQTRFGAEEFGLNFGQLADRAERVEQLIGDCMAAAGFEYVPLDFSTVRRAMTSDKTALGLNAAEFLNQYGYGISTQPDKPIVSLSRGDPNNRIYDDLPPVDQIAYTRALLGSNEEATLAYAIEAEDFSRTGGCTRSAAEHVFSPSELANAYLNPADALFERDARRTRPREPRGSSAARTHGRSS